MPEDNNTEFPFIESPDGWGKRLKRWLKRNFTSVILPILIVIVVIGGLYLYLNQQSFEEISLDNTGAPASNNILDQLENADIIVQGSTTSENNAKDNQASPEPEVIIENQPAPVNDNPVISARAISVSAQAGQGVTHLARSALKQYLQDNRQTLSPAQKIFVEDYLKDRSGERGLEIGETLEFDTSLIEQAINASQQLNDKQIQHINENFVPLVPSL